MKRKKTGAPPVATVAKALSALRSFIDGQDRWGVRELGAALKMPPSTVHRLLARFILEGFVSFDKNHQKYSVGFEFTRLAAAVMQRHGLRSAALPVMRELTERTGEGVWLALYDPDQGRTAYIAETSSIHASRYVAPLGRSSLLAETACGTAILAGMTEHERKRTPKLSRRASSADDDIAFAQTNGFAVMRAAEVDSALTIAASVRNAAGAPVGSLAIVVPLYRMGVGQQAAFGAMVRDAAQRLSSQMGAKLLGGASVGSWKDGVGVISGLLQASNPALGITPALGGGGQNLEEIEEGSGAYALTVASSLVEARKGRGQFRRRLHALRTVMHLSELHFLIVLRSDAKLRGIRRFRAPARLAGRARLFGRSGFPRYAATIVRRDIGSSAQIAAYAGLSRLPRGQETTRCSHCRRRGLDDDILKSLAPRIGGFRHHPIACAGQSDHRKNAPAQFGLQSGKRPAKRVSAMAEGRYYHHCCTNCFGMPGRSFGRRGVRSRAHDF